jgi:flagellar protein FliJ
MTRHSSVRLLTDVAQTRTDAAARELGVLAAQARALEEKLALLLQYREDYESRYRTAVRDGLDQAAWENFQSFMGKLDAAIEQQRLSVAQFRQRLSAGEARWREERRKLDSFDALSRRYEQSEAVRRARGEQREQDEHAAKVHGAHRAQARRDL